MRRGCPRTVSRPAVAPTANGRALPVSASVRNDDAVVPSFRRIAGPNRHDDAHPSQRGQGGRHIASAGPIFRCLPNSSTCSPMACRRVRWMPYCGRRGRRSRLYLSSGRPTGTLRSRVMAASKLLNEQLGAVTHVEANGGYVIRGEGCPLSALTGKHPSVCRAMESLVKEFVGASVHECCERAQRPRCCFEIKSKATE